ncbi:MAG: DnaB-like helicase C-terminal domain-containing protein [Angelakisella sp.]
MANRIEFETAIIGTMLYFPECVGTAAVKLKATDFAGQPEAALFDAICKLHFAGAPIDRVTVVKELGSEYAEYVLASKKYAVLPHDFDYYCESLLYFAQLESVRNQAYAIFSAERLEDVPPLVDRLNEKLSIKRDIKIISAQESAASFALRMNEPAPEYLKLGMKTLDEKLFIEPGDFVVVGGYPSAGKTMLALQFALNLAISKRIGFFSLETSPAKLTDRLMCHGAQVKLDKIKRRELDDDDWKSIAEYSSDMKKLSIDLIPASGMTVRDIQAIALSRRYDVIFVDYLQLVKSGGGNRYEEVTNISKDLHTLSQSQGITVIALAQLSRPEKSSKGQDGKLKPPTMASFRESGQIEQDADVAILLWASDPNNNRSSRILKIAKNKEGERAKIDLEFSGELQTFTPALLSLSEQLKAVTAQSEQNKQVEFTEINDSNGKFPF